MAVEVQKLSQFGGKYMMGVTFCAMDKYREPCSKEQYQSSVKSIKVKPPISSAGGVLFVIRTKHHFIHEGAAAWLQ